MGKQELSYSPWIALSAISLSGCALPTDAPDNNEPPVAASSPMKQPPTPHAAASTETDKSGVPFAQGKTDVEGLTSAQIDAMFAEAFKLVKPFAEHQAVCLAMATDVAGRQGDPPAAAQATFHELTDLPVYPASRCAFEVFPSLIDSGERAMLYTVVVEPLKAGSPTTFWAHAIYGNLGANGAQFVLRRGLMGWYAISTGVSSIS